MSVLEGERPGLGNRQGRLAKTTMSGEQEVSKETHFNRRLLLSSFILDGTTLSHETCLQHTFVTTHIVSCKTNLQVVL